MVKVIKTCNRCGEKKPKELFYGAYAFCIECRKIGCKKYYNEHKKELNLRQRERYAKSPTLRLGYKLKAHRLTINDYNVLLGQQAGKCAICKNGETECYKGKKRRLAVDHCHKTGQIRGLLCGKCNKALGLLQDNPQFITNALIYLTGIIEKQ